MLRLDALDEAARREAKAALVSLSGGGGPEGFLIELLEISVDESIGWAHRKLADCPLSEQARLCGDLSILAGLVARAETEHFDDEVMETIRQRHGETLSEALTMLVGS